MNDSKYRYTLYLIVVVIIATIGIQAYWNYKNYKSNKQQLLNDIQVSLDKAVDDYYTNIAQETTLGLKIEDHAQNIFDEDGVLERISKSIDNNKGSFIGIDSINEENLKGITILRGFEADSFMAQKTKDSISHKIIAKDIIGEFKSSNDSIKLSSFEIFTSKVMISISNDTLNLNSIDSLIVSDLNSKDMLVDFFLDFESHKSDIGIKGDQIIKYDKKIPSSEHRLTATSKSKLLPKGSKLKMHFENKTWLVFKRILGGMIISLLIVLAVISSLFYLLKVIKHQKQLAEVKNDLISNITHEFKTPIATIGVALESLQNFDAIKDKDKTKTYLEMSTTQLTKLNTMVEKLLETATLDSENIELNKEQYNLSEVVMSIVKRHQLQNEKSVTLDIDDNVFAKVDIFHFENAINNLVDNAFKYGGPHIKVSLKGLSDTIQIQVSDDGTSLSKLHKERIFEKFYRVPKGNTHDVKGFGIGLYYTKKIIEKHHGRIELILAKTETVFKITLPYA